MTLQYWTEVVDVPIVRILDHSFSIVYDRYVWSCVSLGPVHNLFAQNSTVQSVVKLIGHLTNFGKFLTKLQSPLHNVGQTRNDHSARKSDQHCFFFVFSFFSFSCFFFFLGGGRGGGSILWTAYFLALVQSSSRRFQNFAKCLNSFATDCGFLSSICIDWDSSLKCHWSAAFLPKMGFFFSSDLEARRDVKKEEVCLFLNTTVCCLFCNVLLAVSIFSVSQTFST